MTTKRLTLCLLATALGAAPAFAQTAPSAPPASTSAPSTAGAGGSGQFLTSLGREQLRASRLVGVNIYGPNNERVGDVNEVILDRNGNAAAVVIGVGGFLGIGEKDVAIPYRMVEWSFTEAAAGTGPGTGTGAATNPTGTGSGTATTATSTAGTANTGVGAGTAAAPTMQGGTGQTNTGQGGTGMEGHRGASVDAQRSTGAPGGTANTDASGRPGVVASGNTTMGNTGSGTSNADQGYPTRGTIRMSRGDLQNAPTFAYTTGDAAATRPLGDRPAGAPSPNAPNAPAMAPGNTPPTQRP